MGAAKLLMCAMREGDESVAAFVRSSRYRSMVIRSLKDRSLTPTEIAGVTQLRLPHVSRALREMGEKGLVQVETGGRIRIYSLSNEGKKVAKEVGDERI